MPIDLSALPEPEILAPVGQAAIRDAILADLAERYPPAEGLSASDPAMVVIEAVSRLAEGVVGSYESTQDDSFTTGLLQHPQYTRPAEFRGWEAPEVLRSGNHEEVARWRRREALRRTYERRPDLLESAPLTDEDAAFLDTLDA